MWRTIIACHKLLINAWLDRSRLDLSMHNMGTLHNFGQRVRVSWQLRYWFPMRRHIVHLSSSRVAHCQVPVVRGRRFDPERVSHVGRSFPFYFNAVCLATLELDASILPMSTLYPLRVCLKFILYFYSHTYRYSCYGPTSVVAYAVHAKVWDTLYCNSSFERVSFILQWTAHRVLF